MCAMPRPCALSLWPSTLTALRPARAGKEDEDGRDAGPEVHTDRWFWRAGVCAERPAPPPRLHGPPQAPRLPHSQVDSRYPSRQSGKFGEYDRQTISWDAPDSPGPAHYNPPGATIVTPKERPNGFGGSKTGWACAPPRMRARARAPSLAPTPPPSRPCCAVPRRPGTRLPAGTRRLQASSRHRLAAAQASAGLPPREEVLRRRQLRPRRPRGHLAHAKGGPRLARAGVHAARFRGAAPRGAEGGRPSQEHSAPRGPWPQASRAPAAPRLSRGAAAFEERGPCLASGLEPAVSRVVSHQGASQLADEELAERLLQQGRPLLLRQAIKRLDGGGRRQGGGGLRRHPLSSALRRRSGQGVGEEGRMMDTR